MPSDTPLPAEIGCPCSCHGGGSYAACDVLGGCGHLHRPTAPTEPSEVDHSRRCARQRRCPDKQRVLGPDGKPVKEPVNGGQRIVYLGARIDTERGLCTVCTQTVRNEIPHLAADYRELASLLPAGGDATGEMVTSTRDLPVPIRLSVEALMKAIDVEVTVWAEQVATAIGAEWDAAAAHSSRGAVRVGAAVDILANTTDTLTTLPAVTRDVYRHGERAYSWHPVPATEDSSDDGAGWWEALYRTQDGLDAALTMLELHDRTRILAGRGELVHRLPAPCPRCDRLTLVRPNGKDHVECEACHHRWPESDYTRLCLVLASDENRKISLCDRCDKTGRLPDARRTVCDHRKKAAA